MKKTIQHWFSLFLMMVLASLGSVSAQDAPKPSLSIADFSIEAGETKKVTIDLNQAGQKLLAFQADIELPDGLTITEKGKDKPKGVEGSLEDDETPIATYSNGRIVVYNSDGLLFNPDATAIVTLTIVADANFKAGEIKLTNVTISAEGNVKIVAADAVTKVNGGTVVPSTYGITIHATENGTVTADKTEAEAGEKVTLTLAPADGFELDAITITDANDAAVTLSADNTFEMPAAAVIITATFKKKEVAPSDGPKIFIEDFSIEAGETKKVTIDLDQAGQKLLAFQADIELPEGLTITEKGKDKPKGVEGSLEDDETPIATYSNGRIVVYNSDGLLFNPDATAIVTLTIVADDNFTAGEIKLTSVTISAEGNVKIVAPDAVTKVNGGGVVPVTTYQINVANSDNGTVTVEKTEVAEGSSVILTVAPAEGYELDAITVTDANGANVEVSANNTFVMPASDVTVTATFKEKEVVPANQPKLFIADFDIEAGATEQVTIDLDQAGNKLLAFQADIILPEGLTIQGKPKAVEGTLEDEETPIVTYSKDNGRIVVYNSDGLLFNADATAIVTLTLQAAEDFKGGEIKLANIVISAEGNEKIKLTEEAVTKVELDPGVTDPKLSIADFEIETSSTKQVTIDLDQGRNNLLAFQADIVLPEGLTIQGKPKAVEGTLEDEETPTVTFANGRIVVYNSDGLLFNPDATSIVTLTLKASKNFQGGEIKLTNVIISKEGSLKFEAADAVTKVTSKYVTPPTYAITIAEGVEHGTIAVDKTEAEEEDTITVTATPDKGYYLVAITVNGESIEGNSFEMPAEDVTINAIFKAYVYDFDEQEYLLQNVGAGQYLGAGNDWGTRASFVKHAEYVRLIPQEGDNVYFLETQVSNGGEQYYLGTNGYMDSNAAPFTFQKQENGNYTITSPDGAFIGFDGTSTIVSITLTDADANAQWSIIKLTDAKAALAAATEAQPMDATFLINDPNFGRNNRNKGSWNMEASNKNLGGGDVKNFCAESYRSVFTLSQVLTDVPNGLYTLTAQGFYRQDGQDGEHLPVFYANEAAVTFPEKTGTENSMTDASNSFSQGLYTIDPIYVKVVDGTLTIGAKLEENTMLWCIWDNFELTYYGPEAEIPAFAISVAADIQNGTVSVDKTEAKRGELITVTATPAEGYELEAITVNGVAIKGNTFEMPAKDATVGATFKIKQFIVKFVIGEEVILEQKLDFGATITAPEAPEKEGYTFSWGDVAETVPAQDVTYEGTYTINQYTVKFVIGEEVISEKTLDFGSAIAAPEAPEKEGYTFAGWDEVPATVPASDVVVKGSYTINQYTVKFVIGNDVISEQKLDYGSAISTPEAPEKEGYTFNGWGSVDETVPAKDVTYEGSYTVNIYAIYYYDEDDEIFAVDSVAYGASIELRDYTPKNPDRFTFLGWVGDEKFETMPARDLQYKASLKDGIRAIFAGSVADVFTLNGTKVRSNATADDLQNLPAGIYIIGGKKVVVK